LLPQVKAEVTMLAIEFWIVRKGDDPWKVAPEVADAISGHPPRKCLFCGEGQEIIAVIAFHWRAPDAHLYTAGLCQRCEAGHGDENLAEMVQQEVFPDLLAVARSIEEVCDQMEAKGLLETMGIDPITGSKRRRLTAKGRESADLEARVKEATKH
jgi:hypothetical protein